MNHVAAGDATLTTVDATDETSWVYLDLKSGEQQTVSDPSNDDTWDLAFQRFHIMSNGGASGPGGVEVAKVEGVAFDEVSIGSAGEWSTDQPDGDDDDLLNDFVFGDWYAYDPMTHTLSPAPRVYLVRTGDGDAFKLELQDYYSEAGSSGTPTFMWKRVQP